MSLRTIHDDGEAAVTARAFLNATADAFGEHRDGLTRTMLYDVAAALEGQTLADLEDGAAWQLYLDVELDVHRRGLDHRPLPLAGVDAAEMRVASGLLRSAAADPALTDPEKLAAHRVSIALAEWDAAGTLDHTHPALVDAVKQKVADGVEVGVLHTGGGGMMVLCADVGGEREVWLTREEEWLVGYYDREADPASEGVFANMVIRDADRNDPEKVAAVFAALVNFAVV